MRFIHARVDGYDGCSYNACFSVDKIGAVMETPEGGAMLQVDGMMVDLEEGYDEFMARFNASLGIEEGGYAKTCEEG